MRKTVLTCVALLCACMATVSALCQTFDMEQDRVQMADLRGQFRFHAGDDPRWAAPTFDDSAWQLLASDQSWDQQGYRGYTGYAWYRFRVVLPATDKSLSIYLPVFTNFEVFIDGHLIGDFGKMPPRAVVLCCRFPTFRLPAHPSEQRTIQVALRVWRDPTGLYNDGGVIGIPRIGFSDQIDLWHDWSWKNSYWQFSITHIQLLIAALSALASLAFFMLFRLDAEYLWFGLFELCSAFSFLVSEVQGLASNDLLKLGLFGAISGAVGDLLFCVFLWSFLRQKRTTLYWSVCGIAVAAMVPQLLGNYDIISITSASSASLLCEIAYAAVILFFLLSRAPRKQTEARAMTVVVTTKSVLIVFNEILGWFYNRGRMNFSWLGWYEQLFAKPFPVDVSGIVTTIVNLGLVAIVIVRFARTRRDEQRLHSEVEAARLVQHVLIPETIPAVPGYQIESVYKPAGEVGGDFFQIIPLKSGSVLIAVGDVSGKGVPAAMTVALLRRHPSYTRAFNRKPIRNPPHYERRHNRPQQRIHHLPIGAH